MQEHDEEEKPERTAEDVIHDLAVVAVGLGGFVLLGWLFNNLHW